MPELINKLEALLTSQTTTSEQVHRREGRNMVFQGTISVVSTAFGKDVIDETRKESRSQIMEGLVQ